MGSYERNEILAVCIAAALIVGGMLIVIAVKTAVVCAVLRWFGVI